MLCRACAEGARRYPYNFISRHEEEEEGEEEEEEECGVAEENIDFRRTQKGSQTKTNSCKANGRLQLRKWAREYVTLLVGADKG